MIDLGWFSFIARGMSWLLRAIYGFVGNWGFAIVLLTLLVRVLLLPAVSLTPGRNPTQISQSKSLARGEKEDSSVTGLVKMASPRLPLSIQSSCRPSSLYWYLLAVGSV